LYATQRVFSDDGVSHALQVLMRDTILPKISDDETKDIIELMANEISARRARGG
jgi:hypothetical protein